MKLARTLILLAEGFGTCRVLRFQSVLVCWHEGENWALSSPPEAPAHSAGIGSDCAKILPVVRATINNNDPLSLGFAWR